MSHGGVTPSDLSEAARQMLIAEVKKQMEAAMSANQSEILSGIQKTISEAVDTKYKVVIAQLGPEKNEKDSHTWQIVLAVLPILLTVGLGWWVTKAQTEITKRIDDQKQDLAARLVLTQEYQKRKLDVYQACTKSLSTLTQALEALRVDPTDQKAASDAVHDLYDCTQNNSLYVTTSVAEPLEAVQTDAIAIMQKAGNGGVNTVSVEADVGVAKKRMLEEFTSVTVPLNSNR